VVLRGRPTLQEGFGMSRISPSGFIPLALLILTINVPAQVSPGAVPQSTAVISGRITNAGHASQTNSLRYKKPNQVTTLARENVDCRR